MGYSTFGRHVVMDMWGVDYDFLNNAEWLEELLVEAATNCGATVCSVLSKQFEPQGITVLLLLSESHLSIHTYPEKGFAALDCYICGENANPERVLEYLAAVLMPTSTYEKKLIRGIGKLEVQSI
ncbi:adenosylmethionine decarboxylase [Paenibacillus fonticola]|uniref:adenosylmethionine decarboxylase n=1 Tax=Paenibacillus fonticola TaxID=379896 RepID=UPI0003755D95|nr:adenosylmethionine decarboxylase [Paenibacillus fonticola]